MVKYLGVDSISADIVKRGGPSVVSALNILCQNIWTNRQWHKDWMDAVIFRKRQHPTLAELQNDQPDQLDTQAKSG